MRDIKGEQKTLCDEKLHNLYSSLKYSWTCDMWKYPLGWVGSGASLQLLAKRKIHTTARI
jgi:hypothetical protein